MIRTLGAFTLAIATIIAWSSNGAGGEKKEDKKEEKKPASATPDPIVMVGFGGVTGAYLYHAHQQLGYLAHAVIKDPGKDRELESHIRIVQGLANVMDKQLAKILEKTPLTDADKTAITSVRSINTMLADQSKQLLAFRASKNDADFDKFQETRTQTWKRIVQVMKVDESKGSIEKKVMR